MKFNNVFTTLMILSIFLIGLAFGLILGDMSSEKVCTKIKVIDSFEAFNITEGGYCVKDYCVDSDGEKHYLDVISEVSE